jgi:hypothetical protein
VTKFCPAAQNHVITAGKSSAGLLLNPGYLNRINQFPFAKLHLEGERLFNASLDMSGTVKIKVICFRHVFFFFFHGPPTKQSLVGKVRPLLMGPSPSDPDLRKKNYDISLLNLPIM